MRSNTASLLVRNVSHLGLGQVASTALGILQTAVIGRALEPSQLGILYTVLAISTFAYVVVEWGQGTYLVREVARGRIDESELLGSALVIRLATVFLSSVVAAAAALILGYGNHVVLLTMWAMMAGVPGTLLGPIACSFRARNRMDLDASANIIGKAITLIATALALSLGGGLAEVILMGAVGGISMLLFGVVAAARLEIKVTTPEIHSVRELVRHGAPIAAFSLVIASQPFVEIMMLSALTSPAIVGWFGAFRSTFGIVVSPAIILVAASFPELSRASLSLPDFRRVLDVTGRVLFIAAAFASSGLYLFASDLVAVIYGHGRFEQTASILRVGAVFIPVLFLGYVLATAMNAVGRNKSLAAISIVRIAFCATMGWLLIDYWQQRFGNGGIALVIVAGVAELPTTVACWALLPKGAVGSNILLNMLRACVTSLSTVVPLAMLQPLGLLYLIPVFVLVFAVTAIATRLILPSDLKLVVQVVRSRVFAPQATKSAPDS